MGDSSLESQVELTVLDAPVIHVVRYRFQFLQKIQ